MTLKYDQVADALAKLKFPEQVSDPAPYTNDGYLYSKDSSGKTELFYMNDLGNITQITNDGYLYIRGGIITPPFENLSTLALTSIIDLPPGTMAYVKSVDDVYYLKKGITSYILDEYNVINTPEADGYWISRMEGRWDDLQGDISQGVGNTALTYDPFSDTPWYFYCMRHDQNDALSFRYQLPHRWKHGTSIFPHLHMLPLADPASTEHVFFDGYYTWSQNDYFITPVPDLSGWTRFTLSVPINPGDINVQKYVDFGEVIPPSWAIESTIFLFYVRRSGTTTADSYTTSKPGGGTAQANLGLLSADIHFRTDKNGSLLQIPD